MNYVAVVAAVVGATVSILVILILIMSAHYKKLRKDIDALNQQSHDTRTAVTYLRETMHKDYVRLGRVEEALQNALPDCKLQSLAIPNNRVRLIRFPKQEKA
jgi:hypothetical protein